jgi:hypothetical protein
MNVKKEKPSHLFEQRKVSEEQKNIQEDIEKKSFQ